MRSSESSNGRKLPLRSYGSEVTRNSGMSDLSEEDKRIARRWKELLNEKNGNTKSDLTTNGGVGGRMNGSTEEDKRNQEIINSWKEYINRRNGHHKGDSYSRCGVCNSYSGADGYCKSDSCSEFKFTKKHTVRAKVDMCKKCRRKPCQCVRQHECEQDSHGYREQRGYVFTEMHDKNDRYNGRYRSGSRSRSVSPSSSLNRSYNGRSTMNGNYKNDGVGRHSHRFNDRGFYDSDEHYHHSRSNSRDSYNRSRSNSRDSYNRSRSNSAERRVDNYYKGDRRHHDDMWGSRSDPRMF